MGLRNVTLMNCGSDAVTLVIPNGATERTLVSSPATVSGGLQLIFAEDLNAVVRRSLTYRSKMSTYDAKAKTWSKSRREIAVSIPVEVSPGVYQSLTGRFILEVPAICTQSEIASIIDDVVQCAKDTEAQNMLKIGTLD